MLAFCAESVQELFAITLVTCDVHDVRTGAEDGMGTGGEDNCANLWVKLSFKRGSDLARYGLSGVTYV